MSDNTIVVEYDLPAPPAKVWRTLTEPKLLARWLMENDLVPEVGRRFQFRPTPIPGMWNGITDCEVLEVVPLERLRYSWIGGDMDSIVTWTLAATATGTKLRLEHAMHGDAKPRGYDMIDKGWRGKGGSIGEIAAAL